MCFQDLQTLVMASCYGLFWTERRDNFMWRPLLPWGCGRGRAMDCDNITMTVPRGIVSDFDGPLLHYRLLGFQQRHGGYHGISMEVP